MPVAPDGSAPISPELAPRPAVTSSESPVIPGEYVVLFKAGVADVEGKAREKTVSRRATLRHTFTAAVKGFSAQLTDSAASALRADPDVAVVEPDRVVHMSATQSGATWGLDRLDQRDLPLSGAFTYATDASNVTVYILDTGINLGHVEFGGRAFAGLDAITAGGAAQDCNGHGTHVAGTVGGTTYGVAKRATLVAVRVLDCNGSGSSSAVIAGVDYVTRQKQANPSRPMVANMSLGGGHSYSLDQAVAASISAGVVYAVAAGNSTVDACTGSPGRLPQALTVAASSSADGFASFSNFGSCVDLAAPGVGITSAWIGSTTALGGASGTSMATPHVAGAAALYLATNPAATAAQVSSALLSNATSGRLSAVPAGTPNLLLNTGEVAAPAPAPLPATGARFDAPLVSGAGANACMSFASSALVTPATLATCVAGAVAQSINLPAVGTAGLVKLFGGTLCLDDFGARGLVGDRVGIYTCFPGAAPQMWTLTSAGDLRGINGLCVDASAAASTGYITLQTCNGGAGQRWSTTAPSQAPVPTPVPTPTTRFDSRLVNGIGSTLCMTVRSTALVTPATLAACVAGSAGQQINLPAVGSAGLVQLFGSSVCLDDFGARGLVGDAVGIYTCYPGAPTQTWTLTAAGELRGINGLCVDASGATNGGPVTLQTCNGGAGQPWTPSATTPAPPPTTTPPATPTTRFDAQLVSGAGANLCLTLNSAAPMTLTSLGGCAAGSASQRINLPPVGTSGLVQLFNGTVCLDDYGAKGMAGDWVGIYGCYPGAAPQTWTLTSAGELRGINGLCVDANAALAGGRITLQQCNGSAGQRWTANVAAASLSR